MCPCYIHIWLGIGNLHAHDLQIVNLDSFEGDLFSSLPSSPSLVLPFFLSDAVVSYAPYLIGCL